MIAADASFAMKWEKKGSNLQPADWRRHRMLVPTCSSSLVDPGKGPGLRAIYGYGDVSEAHYTPR